MSPASRKRSASPNRLDNLDAIALAQFMLYMTAARHDFAIDFNRHAPLATAGFGQQRSDRRGGRAFVCLTIEKNLHPQSVALLAKYPSEAAAAESQVTEGRSGKLSIGPCMVPFVRQRSWTIAKSMIAARRWMFLRRRLAVFGCRPVARRRGVALRCPLHLPLTHLLLTLHFHGALLLLHLHRALLLLHLHRALLLHCLFALALLRLQLQLVLLLHLLLTGTLLRGLFVALTLLCLHLRLALLCLFLALLHLPPELLRLDVRLTLLRRCTWGGRLRRAFHRLHHGQASRCGRVALRFARGTDCRCTRQRAFAGMREACAGQFARTLRRLHRLIARIRLSDTPGRTFGGPRRRDWLSGLIACCRSDRKSVV